MKAQEPGTATLELTFEQWRMITVSLRNSNNLDWREFGETVSELVDAQI
jgi:hypothetical protein